MEEANDSIDIANNVRMISLPQIKMCDNCECIGSDDDIWADDISKKRKLQAQALIDLIVVQENPCTICLNGDWGSGKTFFLTRLVKEYCKKIAKGAIQNPVAIYFNAWKDDFLKDPLFSVLGQITQADGLQQHKTILAEVKNAAKPLLAQTGLEFTKYLLKGVVSKVAGIDIDELKDVFNLSLGDIMALEAKDLHISYKELCKSRDLLREKLVKLSQANWNITHQPLVIIIDELDRCRPIFAIELLERIKHLFDVPHIVFLIGMDTNQFKKSLKAVYGDIDTQNYLLKFIDLKTMLPPLSRNDFIDSLWHTLGYDCLTLPNCNGVVYEKNDSVLDKFKLLARVRNLTLREIEQCIRLFLFLARPYKMEVGAVSAEMIAVGIILKVVDTEMYEKFMRWEFEVGEMIDVIVPARVAKNDFVDIRNLIGEMYKLVSSVDPMGVFRQNLTFYARHGKPMIGSSSDNFYLPKFIKNQPPVEWKNVCRQYSSGMIQANGAVNHAYLQGIREIQVRTMNVIKDSFMLVGEMDE